jgi:predicted AAA+ superfamily ATPase
MSKRAEAFQRPLVERLEARLAEPRRFMQVVAGPRQVGKTTLVRQALERTAAPSHFASADEPGVRDRGWLEAQWSRARLLAEPGARGPAATTAAAAVLAIDEIQKVPQWSEVVKRLCEKYTASRTPLHVVVLGSAPLLLQRGLSESLAGRFELLRATHWSFLEMRAAFGFSLEDYLFFGGYPGAASLSGDPERWRSYVLEALIEATIARDLLLLTRVDKPALLRRLFELGCHYSGQVLSYTKVLGQLQDAGNTVTLAHYLELLESAGLLAGLSKFAGEVVRQRGSSPKFQVLNGALLSAVVGMSPAEALAPGEHRGRVVESAVGASLAAAAAERGWSLHYWREGAKEVDFVVQAGRKVTAIEVKGGDRRGKLSGLAAFGAAFRPSRSLVVGADGIPLEEFFSKPMEHWVAS